MEVSRMKEENEEKGESLRLYTYYSRDGLVVPAASHFPPFLFVKSSNRCICNRPHCKATAT